MFAGGCSWVMLISPCVRDGFITWSCHSTASFKCVRWGNFGICHILLYLTSTLFGASGVKLEVISCQVYSPWCKCQLDCGQVQMRGSGTETGYCGNGRIKLTALKEQVWVEILIHLSNIYKSCNNENLIVWTKILIIVVDPDLGLW